MAVVTVAADGAAVVPAAVPDATVEPVVALVVPRPSALSATNSECRKLCTFCADVVAVLLVAAAVEAVDVLAAEVPAVPDVAAELPAPLRADTTVEAAVAASDVTPGTPDTVCKVCSRLLNRPCVELDAWLVLLDAVEPAPDPACTPLLWP